MAYVGVTPLLSMVHTRRFTAAGSVGARKASSVDDDQARCGAGRTEVCDDRRDTSESPLNRDQHRRKNGGVDGTQWQDHILRLRLTAGLGRHHKHIGVPEGAP